MAHPLAWLVNPTSLLLVTLCLRPLSGANPSEGSDLNTIQGKSSSSTTVEWESYAHPVPGDVLTSEQKRLICSLPKVEEELCPAAGSADAYCGKISSAVNGSAPRCDLKHVCSFTMPTDNVPALNITLPPYTTVPTANPILSLRREPNRAYVTVEYLEDIVVARECEGNGLIVFAPEMTKDDGSKSTTPVTVITKNK